MSSIAEVYAKDLGVKIGKPVITDHFYPNTIDKYIYFNPHGDYPSQEYLYWDVVFPLIKDSLSKRGIEIMTAPKSGGVTAKQDNHLIKNSLLYIGTSSYRVQISDIYEVPSVCVLGNMYESNFNLFKYAEVLTPDFSDVKPSFDMQEPKNRVNEIKPEAIAEIILAQLEIEDTINFKTVRIGQNFQNKTAEIVPNFFEPYEELRGKPINLRSDIYFDLEMVSYWCQHCIVNLYLDKPLEQNIIANLPNLKQIIFKYTKDQEKEDLSEFFKILKFYKKNVIIEVSEEDIISDVRLKYFDFNVILKDEFAEEVKDLPENCKYISNKKFISNGDFYSSESSEKRLDKSRNFVYDEISKSEIESLYLYVEK